MEVDGRGPLLRSGRSEQQQEDRRPCDLHFLQVTSFFGGRVPKVQGHLPELDLLVPRAPAVLLELVGGLGVNTGLAKVPAGREGSWHSALRPAQPDGYPTLRLGLLRIRSTIYHSTSASAVPPQPLPPKCARTLVLGAHVQGMSTGAGRGLPAPGTAQCSQEDLSHRS